MSDRCKIKVLGKDPNNPKRPARYSGDPKKNKQQKMAVAACRKGKREDWLNKRKGDLDKLFNKKKKDSI